MTLTNKTKIGVFWNFAEQIARRGITVFVTLVLAYFLTPEDFGLLAMMTLFIALATGLMDSGVKEALIRLPVASESDLSTAFYMNIGLGLLAYAILFFTAPLIANFYEEERLVQLLRVAGLVVLINAFQGVQVAIFSRELNFKAQLHASVPAALISGILAILLAYFDFGVWALIAQIVISAFVMTVLLWFQSSWHPNLNFSKASFIHLFSFGYKLFISMILAIFAKNIITLAVAKAFSATVAGLYYLVDKIMDILMAQLVYAVQNVTFPALASIQDDDVRLKEAYRKVIKVVTFIVFPVLLFGAALADPLFKTFFPENWWPASTYFQIMCFGFLLYPLHAINLNILKVKGRSDLFLKLEVIKVVTSVTLLLLALPYGMEAILWSQVLASVIAYIPNSYYSAVLIDYSIVQQVKDFFKSLITVVFVSVGLVSINENLIFGKDWFSLVLYFMAMILFLFLSFLLKSNSSEILFNTLKRKSK